MNKVLAFLILVVSLTACDKDKFKTEPQVEIKSLSPESVQKGQIFSLNATVRDQEGDLQDSILLVRKRFNNTTLLSVDTMRFYIGTLPFPDKSEIEVQALFSYGELRDNTIFMNLESADRNLVVGVIARDKAGHRSAYVESAPIVLKKL
jgi:hypothetical protein